MTYKEKIKTTIKETFQTMKEHKFSAFLGMGGIVCMGLMQADLINYDLIVPKIMVATGAQGVSNILYEMRKKKPDFNETEKRGAFLAFGGLLASAIFQYTEMPLQGIGQLLLDSVAGYGAVMLFKTYLKEHKESKEEKSILATPKNKEETQSIISKIREKANDTKNEFNPLNLV